MYKPLCLLTLLFLIGNLVIAQSVDEGYLTFKETPQALSPGAPIQFKLVDTSNTLPDSTLVRVDWLDENGHLLDYAILRISNGSACFSFLNNKILKGPTLLRGYFFSKGKPLHTARQFVHVNATATAPNIVVPDSLQPMIINKPFSTVDNFYSMDLIIHEKFPSPSIQYQIANEQGEIETIATVERINDTLLRINDLDFTGKGSMRIYVNSDREFRDYDDFSIQWVEHIGMVAWSTDAISRDAMKYVVEQVALNKKNNRRNDGDALATQYTKEGLPEVIVRGVRKTRTQELEDRYINNNMFRHINSTTISVLDDPSANPNLSVLDYILIKFPQIQMNGAGLSYRGGGVQFFLDEVPFDDISAINIRDLAIIRFVKASIRGLNTVSGPVASSGGGRRGAATNTSFGNAGNTGNIIMYTRKGDDKELNLNRKQISLPFVGISLGGCK